LQTGLASSITDNIQEVSLRNYNNQQHPQHALPVSSKVQKITTKTTRASAIQKTILIVDDEFDIALTFKTALQDTGLKVDVYNDSLLALSHFKSNFYYLILIDINMPHMNGFELCEKLLKLDTNSKIYFMSAGQINQEALREVHPNKNIGCFINKPITMDCLISKVKAIVGLD
jgi:CheY-like chemotaxis protein